MCKKGSVHEIVISIFFTDFECKQVKADVLKDSLPLKAQPRRESFVCLIKLTRALKT